MEKTKGMEHRAKSRRRVQVVKAGNKQNGEEQVGYGAGMYDKTRSVNDIGRYRPF